MMKHDAFSEVTRRELTVEFGQELLQGGVSARDIVRGPCIIDIPTVGDALLLL